MGPSRVAFPSEPAVHACPACQKRGAERFYEVRGVPVHSCVLLDSPEDARRFPIGDLRLAACPHCGFVFNDAFDPALLDYGHDYEETQACSGTFMRFLEATVQRLVSEHGWRDGRVLEIGCGRGDFLALLCARGSNRGLGVDPSATAGRVGGAGPGLEFRHESYGAATLDERVTHIATRHTLEHIGPVAAVLACARAQLERSAGAALFVEVPDVLRILEEGAFWDLYYEHCSYFTLGSLARLARSTGFEVDALTTVYGDQYLHMHARPAPASSDTPDPDDRARIRAAVARFRETCRAKLASLDARLESAEGERVALWGGGSKATGFLTTLPGPERVAYVVDINPEKRGKYISGSGHRMLAPDDLGGEPPDRVLVMNPIYLDEIRADLAARGLTPIVEAV